MEPDTNAGPSIACGENGREEVAGGAIRLATQLGIRSRPDVEVLGGLNGQNVIVLLRPESLVAGQQVEESKPNP